MACLCLLDSNVIQMISIKNVKIYKFTNSPQCTYPFLAMDSAGFK